MSNGKRQRLTAAEAADAVRLNATNACRGGTCLPQLFDSALMDWRSVTRGEMARGTRYLRRREARKAAENRRLSNQNAMRVVAGASGLPTW